MFWPLVWLLIDLTSAEESPLWPWKPEEYITLLSSAVKCNNYEILNICDPDQILTEHQIVELSALFNKSQTNDQDCLKSGLRIGLALAQQTFHEKSRSHQLEDFAEDIRIKWRLSNCDNDLIIFLSNNSNFQISISLGNVSREVFGNNFENLYKNLKTDFEKSKTNIFQFILNTCRLLYKEYFSRIYPEKQESTEEVDVTDPWSLIWNILLTTGYLLVILVIFLIACYYCCYKKNDKKREINESVISSEMTTKYSELKTTAIELNEFNIK